MGVSGKIEFTGGGYLSPRYLTSDTNTLQVTGQGIRVGETSGGEIFVDAQNGSVDIYSRDGYPINLSASGGALGADISLTATGDIILNPSGSAKVGSNAIWHAGNIPFSFSSVASGDIIYNNGSNWVNLAKGSDGQTLTLSSGVPTWATPASGVTTFIGLSDTPASYTGGASKLLRVNSSANAVEFVDGSTLYQAADADLTAIAGLAKTNGNFIVGNGTTWVAESGNTVRSSLGLSIGSDVQAHNNHLDDLAALATVSGAEDIMVSTGAGAWGYKDAVYMEANLNSTYNGPKFVGSNIYGSGGTPANQTFSGWLYVRVSGNVYRVPLYVNSPAP